MLSTPNGPLTLEDVTKDAVCAVITNDAVAANDALVEPLAYDALDILFVPNGPKTLEEVINDAVEAVPNNDPVKLDAETDPNTPTLPVNDVLPVIVREPVITWLPLNVFEPVIANTVEFSPSNRSALFANDAVNIKEAVNANEALVEPLA